jgi:hypothetical protein
MFNFLEITVITYFSKKAKYLTSLYYGSEGIVFAGLRHFRQNIVATSSKFQKGFEMPYIYPKDVTLLKSLVRQSYIRVVIF